MCTLSELFPFFSFAYLDARNSSVIYTRWGKKSCPSNAELVFSGEYVLAFFDMKVTKCLWFCFINCFTAFFFIREHLKCTQQYFYHMNNHSNAYFLFFLLYFVNGIDVLLLLYLLMLCMFFCFVYNLFK